MKSKKITAALMSGVCAVTSVFSAAAFSVSAEEASEPVYRKSVQVDYYPSEGAMSTNNDGVSVRRNIINMWGSSQYYHNVEDIDSYTNMIDHVKVDFTVSGIGEDSVLTKDDGTTEPYVAWLCGSIGTNQGWNPGDEGIPYVEIKGDGNYSLTWDLALDSETVDCLILQTNINYFSYLPEDTEAVSVLDSPVRIDITSISTLSEGWTLYGDSNMDGKVSLADAVTILQYIANKDKYYLTSYAREASDVFEHGDGITPNDALAIQQYDAGLIDDLNPPAEPEE